MNVPMWAFCTFVVLAVWVHNIELDVATEVPHLGACWHRSCFTDTRQSFLSNPYQESF